MSKQRGSSDRSWPKARPAGQQDEHGGEKEVHASTAGGISGNTMTPPGLADLSAALRADYVDVVVVTDLTKPGWWENPTIEFVLEEIIRQNKRCMLLDTNQEPTDDPTRVSWVVEEIAETLADKDQGEEE